MKVVFRVDASLEIGTGHVMRCLTLADELRKCSDEIVFICRELDGNLIDIIENKGYPVVKLKAVASFKPENLATDNNLFHAQWLGASQHVDAMECAPFIESMNPDWLIIDHYAIDYRWQAEFIQRCKKIMVIDDLADRKHSCDLLLDQTYGRKKEDYLSLVSENCRLLMGSGFSLLRSEFSEWREFSIKRRHKTELKKILVTLGGVDQHNITFNVLEALEESNLPNDIEVTVIMGGTAPNLKQVRQLAYKMSRKTNVRVGVENMAEIMTNSDLAIGAAGSTTWERCCLGLPTILLVLAENQFEAATVLAEEKIVKLLPSDERIKPHLITQINKITENYTCLSTMTNHAIKVTDGMGVMRVLKVLEELNA